MRHELTVTVDFLRAPEFPTFCFYTGRTDRVEWRPVPGWMNFDRVGKRNPKLRLPQAPLPLRLQLWKLRLQNLPFFVVIIGMLWWWMRSGPTSWSTTVVLIGSCKLFAVVMDWIGSRWAQGFAAIESGPAAGTAVLSFPADQAARYQQYRQAFAAYCERLAVEDPETLVLPETVAWNAPTASDWQTAGANPSPQWPAGLSEQAPWQLDLPLAFFHSRFLPRRCLLTGKTTGVQRVLQPMYSWGDSLTTGEFSTVPIPQTTGAMERHRMMMILPWVPLALLPMIVFPLLTILVPNLVFPWPAIAFLTACLLGLGLFLTIRAWVRATQVRWTPRRNDGELRLVFPTLHRDTYLAFHTAWQEYQQALDQGEQTQLLHVPPAPTADTEAWADRTSDDRWDQT